MYYFDTESLDGLWDFNFLGDVDADKLNIADISYDDFMNVPGCFDATPAYAGWRGVAAYRRMITLDCDAAYKLYIDGAHHWCRVLLDGKTIGEHIGGFTQFAVDIPAGSAAAELVILVDNRIDYDRCPLHLEYFDWYHFGGIARGVRLRRLGDIYIDSVRAITKDCASGLVEVTVAYENNSGDDCQAALTLLFDGKAMVNKQADLKSGCGELAITLELPEAQLWSPDNPALHNLCVTLASDSWSGDIGIRQVAVSGKDILINGQSVQIRGFNRHEAHPQFGHTQPAQLLVSDLQQMKAMNVNFVRGSHYPQDEAFMALCDKLGIMMWCESVAWQHTGEHLNDPKFVDAQLTNGREMIEAAVNHPSVIMWGALNEGRSDDSECCEGYAKILNNLRELDSSRPITYASNHPMDDKCFDLADIISINCYPGWYSSEIDEIPDRLEKLCEHLEACEHSAGKPLIISEIGAGAIYGWRDRHGQRWSEQYQQQLIETVLEHIYTNDDKFAGVILWQFCDMRTAEPAYKSLGRPRAFNNKGIVDEYRREKLAFDSAYELFTRYAKD